MFTETLTRRVLGSSLLDLLTGPYGVDRYTELVSPTWVASEARARVVEVRRTTPRSVTLTLAPNAAFGGFRAGQHVNLSVDIDGRRRTRCYSPANAEGRRLIEITVGVHDGGLVSTHLYRRARVGMVVGLDNVGGDFVLPAIRPRRILLISGGSGITPVMSMLRTLTAEGYAGRLAFIHYARSREEACYRDELAAIPRVRVLHGYTRTPAAGGSARLDGGDAKLGPPHETGGSARLDGGEAKLGPPHETGDLSGHFDVEHLRAALPDPEAVYVCGPPALVEAVRALRPDAISESFVPPSFAATEASGGRVTFLGSAISVVDDGRPLLEQAEAAGLQPVSGCRMGVCHSCTCRKTSGTVRNLITGAVSTGEAEDIQICVSAPVGDVEIAL